MATQGTDTDKTTGTAADPRPAPADARSNGTDGADGQKASRTGSGAGGAPAGSDTSNTEVRLLKDVQIGTKDKRGRLIYDVLWAVPEFKIYKTAKGISPHFSDDSALAADQRDRYLALGQELAHMNHLIHFLPQGVRWWRRKKNGDVPVFAALTSSAAGRRQTGTGDGLGGNATSTYYEREMARGVAQALTGDAEAGKATLITLAKRLEKRLRNKGRVIYFAMALISAAVIAAAALLFLVFAAAPLAEILPGSTGVDVRELTLVVIMGSLGALLSTAVGLRSLAIDASATLSMNWLYGGQRMLVGVLGALVLYLALRAGVGTGLVSITVSGAADGTIPATIPDAHKLAFVSVLAGFSERLVPNLLDRQSDSSANGADGGGDNSQDNGKGGGS